jgi:ADP-ribose pyrophosphatase YjhB (NUDIX family)
MIWHLDKLLLVRQGRPDSPRWMLPGGGVEAGEGMTEALERELREEIGLTSCRVRDPLAMIESIAPPTSPSGRHLVHIVFDIECSASCITDLRCNDPDVHELRMCTRQELLQIPLHPPIASWLGEWKRGANFAYFGPLWAP